LKILETTANIEMPRTKMTSERIFTEQPSIE